MKTLLLLLIPVFFIASCCTLSSKCAQDELGATFRIVSKQDNHDLLFGPDASYDPRLIGFYSLNGSDTIRHYPAPGANSGGGTSDSVLTVQFDYRQPDTVFVKLDQTETDTLILDYPYIDTRCCGNISDVAPASFNGAAIVKTDGGIYVLRK